MPTHQIKNGDCRIELSLIADCSIDSVVCDPPYELGFMGKSWDRSGIAYQVEVWRECLRVLKHGGHLLAFGGSRTYHRLACAIEDAGFEIRDQIQWIYGSGFPKSLDVGKAIDARGGESISWFGAWLREERQRRGITQKALAVHFPSKTNGLTGCVANWELGLNQPTPDQFNKLCEVLDLRFARIEEAEREITGRNDRKAGWFTSGDGHDVTTAASDAAKQWNGWGTALKPAHEPIVLARKALIGTVAENVLQHGTGGLNIDGCRIQSSPQDRELQTARSGRSTAGIFPSYGSFDGEWEAPNGRWPANVIHDGSEEALVGLPSVTSGNHKPHVQGSREGFNTCAFNTFENQGDSGSAARFFYCAKASQEDRDDGLEEFAMRQRDESRKAGNVGGDTPRNRGLQPRANHHPTVKPTDLMRYLCRLVTPPNGTVLDPFCGSGSTGRGAVLEGFNFIGIELDAEYCAIAEKRIEAVTRQGLLTFA